MVRIVNLPQFLASGAATLANKVRLLVFVLWMSVPPPRVASVRTVVANVVCATTDMGTELGIGEFEAPLRSVLPAWALPARADEEGGLQEDLGLEADCVDASPDSVGDDVHGDRVFPHGMIVAGMMHIIHNLSWLADSKLQHFDTWLAGLKSIVALLHHKHNRDPYIFSCVAGSRFAGYRSVLEKSIPAVVEWRWGVITHIIEFLMPLQFVLKSTFDASKYRAQRRMKQRDQGGEGGEEQDEEHGPQKENAGDFDPTVCERTVTSSFWWGYLHMLNTFHRVLEGLRSWSEQCPCHECFHNLTQNQKSDFVRIQRELNRDYEQWDGVHFKCPASGMRAPELAAGSWEMVFGRLLTSFHEEANAHILGVTDLELAIITNDLHSARTVILDELKSKLHFWRCLPWRCCALAHPDVLVARDHAKQILDDWEAMDQSPVKHHPMTIHMLTGSLKDAIVAFRDGGCRFADDELSALCARLYFVPVNERTIEGIFSQTRLAAENRRVSPPFVSFALRFPMWEQQCKRKREPDQPSLLHLTIDAFQHVRKRRKLPAALGLEGAMGLQKSWSMSSLE